ncbi:MAG: response regulator transcription factor [Lysobacterales bacterium]
MTIRIVLADDHLLVRQGIRAFLETESDFVIVGEAENGEAAAAVCAKEQPDVALIDMVMPGGGGVAATRAIKAASPDTAVVILTSFEDDKQVLAAIRAGALSYLLKDIAAEELVVAVRCAARQEAILNPRIAARVLDALRDAIPAPSSDRLSDRERDVLLLIAEGLSNQGIAARLGIGEKTVKTHVSNILSKLDLGDRTQVAVYAWRNGLVARA